MIDVGLVGAFLGGLLTLLSPCSVMLLPAFFSYAFTNLGAMASRTALFYLGLITTLVPLGLLAGGLGAVIAGHRDLLILIASILVIALGAVQLLGVPVPGLARTGRLAGTSGLAVYLLGTVYGVAGICAGPILGSVLALAAVGGSALYGGLVLLVFAGGMVVPLFLLALVWERVPALKELLRPRELRIGGWRNSWTAIVGGLVTMVLGVLLLVTDGTVSAPGLLDATSQVNLESQVLAATRGIPDLAVVAVAVVILAAVWLVQHRRARSAQESE
jgi:Cytochrome c biogenesis protein